MQEEKIISGKSEDEVWEKISAELTEDTLEYHAIIKQQSKKIVLNIDIDLGGGFENGYAFTSLTAPLQPEPGFKFAIHDDTLIDDVGKFFGMHDVEIGYPEFDKKIIIKTNDSLKTKDLF